MRIFKSEKYIKNNSISASMKSVKGDVAYHGHEFLEMEFFIDGSGIYEVDGVEYPIRKNTLFIVTPSNVHALKNVSARLVNVMFLQERNELWFDNYLRFEKDPAITFDDENGKFLQMLFLEISRNSESAPEYSMSLLHCIFFKLCQERPDADEQLSPYVSRAISFVRANFNHRITLELVSGKLGLSQTYFSDLFRRETGEGFKEYLDGVRFSYAKRLLRYTELSVSEVYQKSGFSDYSNFARRFKSRYRLTPSEYRDSFLHTEKRENVV